MTVITLFTNDASKHLVACSYRADYCETDANIVVHILP